MSFKVKITSGVAALCVIGGAATAWIAPSFAAPGPRGPHDAVYVSSSSAGGEGMPSASFGPGHKEGHGAPAGPDVRGCASPSFSTIGAAVAAASPNETIVVCPGVYPEDVVIPAATPLTITGVGDPIVNAKGRSNGFQVLASGSTVSGFTVGYATGEGILVGSLPGAGGTVSNVTISDNTVISNDLGNPTGVAVSGSSYAECNAGAGNAPGDCGEGIHLLSAQNSTVVGNEVTGNSGGVLLTDENGPASGNQVVGNAVFDNTNDCGVTLAGHHAGTPASPGFNPVAASVGGVFGNTVRGNRIADNGIEGQGGGVILATGAPGGAVYDNTVQSNTIAGNGLAGVTVHAHSPGENLNGNTIRDNVISTNNLDGDGDFTPADDQTTGVFVGSTSSPISITISHNLIEFDHFGIFTTGPVTVTSTPPNAFVGVTDQTGP